MTPDSHRDRSVRPSCAALLSWGTVPLYHLSAGNRQPSVADPTTASQPSAEQKAFGSGKNKSQRLKEQIKTLLLCAASKQHSLSWPRRKVVRKTCAHPHHSTSAGRRRKACADGLEMLEEYTPSTSARGTEERLEAFHHAAQSWKAFESMDRSLRALHQLIRPITLQSSNRKRRSISASLSLSCTAFVVHGLPWISSLRVVYNFWAKFDT